MRVTTGFILAALVAVASAPRASAEAVFGFDDGTFGDWELIDAFGEPLGTTDVSWEPSSEAIDIGDGFNLAAGDFGRLSRRANSMGESRLLGRVDLLD